MTNHSPFADVDTPALLLDAAQLERNLERVQSAATAAGRALRPHAKAHKSPTVGAMQMARGAVGLCCAKLGEAEAMVAGGLPDLLITTPVVGARKITRLIALARSTRIAIVVDNEENLAEIAAAAEASRVSLDVMIDVDVGQGRTGTVPGVGAGALARRIVRSSALQFRGVQGYQGKLQSVPALADRRVLVQDAMAKLEQSVRAVHDVGISVGVLTGGGTGSFPIDLELGTLTELQPGSYVTMDTNYAKVVLAPDPAPHPLGHPLTILTAVISRPTADRAVVDVGWKSASSDSGVPIVAARPDLSFEFAGDEHGIVRSLSGPLELSLGDRLELIPTHCDTTVNLYDRFVVHRAGVLETTWPITARGRSD